MIQYFAWGIPSAIHYTRPIQNNPFNTIFNNLQTGIFSVHSTFFPQSTLQTVYTLQSTFYNLHSIQFARSNLHSAIYSFIIHSTTYTRQSTLYNLHSKQSTLYTLYTLQSLRSTLNIRRESTNRPAMATFWRTFHHDGKISPACWGGGGVHALSFSLYLPSQAKLFVYAPAERADTLLLFL